jgi:hypothetical protein
VEVRIHPGGRNGYRAGLEVVMKWEILPLPGMESRSFSSYPLVLLTIFSTPCCHKSTAKLEMKCTSLQHYFCPSHLTSHAVRNLPYIPYENLGSDSACFVSLGVIGRGILMGTSSLINGLPEVMFGKVREWQNKRQSLCMSIPLVLHYYSADVSQLFRFNFQALDITICE